MEKGWGEYLKSIDILRDKVLAHQKIRLKDACWILYAEGLCSSTWEAFKKAMTAESRKKYMWEDWKRKFNAWNA
jgi:hypothetical protein